MQQQNTTPTPKSFGDHSKTAFERVTTPGLPISGQRAGLAGLQLLAAVAQVISSGCGSPEGLQTHQTAAQDMLRQACSPQDCH
jgi:hypothetical protein